MKKTVILLTTTFLLNIAAWSQNTISGYVYDTQSREPLIGATVFDSLTQTGTTANEFGYYRLSLKKQAALRVSYVGYQTQVLSLPDIRKDTIVNILLPPSVYLGTVTIVGNRDDNIETIQPGKVNVPLERLQGIPSVGGERDLLKALSVLPGVANGAEGTSSLLVRGGGQDQNLFVLDGANTYNTGHLLNFISIFNPDALKKVDFYKGGFPARFGGRLSSVVDVTFREGNKEHFEGRFEVGLINSKLTLEGPIGKSKKTSYLFAARATYLDAFQYLLGNSIKNVKRGRKQNFTGYDFYDINAKITHEFDDKNKLYISYYEGLDWLRFASKQSFARQYTTYANSIVNRAVSARYYKIIQPNFSMNTGLNYTVNISNSKNYDLSQFGFVTQTKPIFDELNESGRNYLEDYNGYIRFDYSPTSKHFIRFGLESTIHQYKTNESAYSLRRYTSDSTILQVSDNLSNPILRGYESAAYIEDEISFTKNIVANIGLRGSLFKGTDKTFANLEPRLAIRYSLPNLFTLNLTAAQTVQYSHALLSNEIGLDKLVWVPSSKDYAPEKANQISFGIAKQLKNIGLDISFDAYYKQMSHLTQFVFRNESNIYQNWQQNTLRNGKGEARGLEFMLNKTQGKFNGLLSYTLSWNNRQYDGFNGDKVYPFKYDRRHIINTYASYQLPRKWKMGFLWTYNTGFRISIPNGQLVNVPFFDYNSLLYTEVNNGKMPNYHRLDMNAVKEKKLKNGRIQTWSINVYNVYSRLNPIFVYVQKEYKNPITGTVSPAKVKGIVLLPIVPSLNYALKF
jgi:CarboxypepD_reg-like domain/TonB dependent receptor/TonB-dependent Receptor Plug Domain